MWTANFWQQAAERAVKSAAQALVLVWGADATFNVISINLAEAAGFAGGAAVLSILSSLITSGTGEPNDPSMVRKTTA
jgi:r1t holin